MHRFSVLLLLFLAVPAHSKSRIKIAPEILSAKSVAVIGKLGELRAQGGWSPNPRRAKAQVEEALEKWGRFKILDDSKQADLVIVVTENQAGGLGAVLQVFKGVPNENSEPLWEAAETGGLTWPTKRAIAKFRKEVQAAEKP